MGIKKWVKTWFLKEFISYWRCFKQLLPREKQEGGILVSLWNHIIPNIGPKNILHWDLCCRCFEVEGTIYTFLVHIFMPATPYPQTCSLNYVLIFWLLSSRLCCPGCGCYKSILNLFLNDACVYPSPVLFWALIPAIS